MGPPALYYWAEGAICPESLRRHGPTWCAAPGNIAELLWPCILAWASDCNLRREGGTISWYPFNRRGNRGLVRRSHLSSVCQDVNLNLLARPLAARPGVAIPSSSQSLLELGWKASAARLLGEYPHLTEPCCLTCKARSGMPTSEGWMRLIERVMGPVSQG